MDSNNYFVLFQVSVISPPKNAIITESLNIIVLSHIMTAYQFLFLSSHSNSQNNTALFYLFSTGNTQSTGSTMSLLKIETLKFVSETYKRRGDTNRI